MSEIREVYINDQVYPNITYVTEWLNVSSSVSLTFTVFEDNNCDIVLDWAIDNNYNIINTETTPLIGGNSVTIYTPVKNRFVRLSVLNIAVQPSVLEVQGFHYVTSGLGLAHLENVGGFVELFVEPSSLRTLQSSDASITITQNGDNIDLVSVDSSNWELSGSVITQKTPVTVNNFKYQAHDESNDIFTTYTPVNNVILGGSFNFLEADRDNAILGSYNTDIFRSNNVASSIIQTCCTIGAIGATIQADDSGGTQCAIRDTLVGGYQSKVLALNGEINASLILGGINNEIRHAGGGGASQTIQFGSIIGCFGGILESSAGGTLQRCHILGGLNNKISGVSANSMIINGNNLVIPSFVGCLMLGDNSSNVLNASLNNQYTSRFSNGYRVYSNATATTGMTMAAGGSSWVAVSDRNMKDIHGEVDYNDYLERLDNIPVYEYNYKGNPKEQRCIGPMAQDYHAYFGCAKDPLGIEQQDFLGILMACVKSLNQKVKEQEERIKDLEARVL